MTKQEALRTLYEMNEASYRRASRFTEQAELQRIPPHSIRRVRMAWELVDDTAEAIQMLRRGAPVDEVNEVFGGILEF